VHTVKKNKESLVVAAKEIGIEVNADKTKYMVMSRDQNAGRSHNMETDNSSFERVEEFKYLGTTLTDQNSIQEEIKSKLKSVNVCYQFKYLGTTLTYQNSIQEDIKRRLKSENACYHSVQNLMSSRFAIYTKL